METDSGRGRLATVLGSPEEWEPASRIVMPRHAEPTIYDVARAAGVSAWHLLQRSGQQPGQADEPIVLPARLVIRGSTGGQQR